MALRIGDAVFHYQHDGGLLRLTRDDPRAFVYTYASLENRPIHASRIEVSDATWMRLRDAFVLRSHAQARQFARRGELEEESALLDALRASRTLEDRGAGAGSDGAPEPAGSPRDAPSAAPGSPPVALPLPGAGYFFDGSADPVSPANGERDPEDEPALAAVRERIARLRGADFLDGRTAALRRALRDTPPGVLPAARIELSPDGLPDAGGTFAAVYRDRLLGIVALDVLRRGARLRPEAYHAPAGEEFELDATERGRVRAHADRVEAEMAELVASDRSGWSTALIVAAARLVTLRQSADSGRLVVLDAFPDGARRVPPADVARRRDLLAPLAAEARSDLAAARGRFFAPVRPRESEWTDLESAANRVIEIDRATSGAPLRIASGRLVPARAAVARSLPVPAVPTAALDAAARVARDDAEAYGRSLESAWSYELIERNCVSEIFAVIDDALAPIPAADPGLGGHVDPRRGLAFVPFLSERAVRRNWAVRDTWTIPSHRSIQVARLAARDGSLAVRLRESNTLTASVYRPAARDSAFLFFTDDVPWLSPLLGAANLATGVAVALAGVGLAPFDDGRALGSGLSGALFSVPELFFANVRKGTFDWVPRGGQEPGSSGASS